MKKWLFITLLLVCSLPILFYGLVELIGVLKRVHVKDGFYIEYMEMYNSTSLRNGNQGFMGNVTEAYWNNDSLVASGGKGCFLIIFGQTKYNDEMILISCDNLQHRLKNKPIKRFIKK